MSRVFGIAIVDGEFKPCEIEDELDNYYKLLKCDTIDIVVRKIGGKYYNIVCDDEGLYKDSRISMMHADMCTPMLVGNLFICGYDGGSDVVSLQNDDVERIRRNWKFHTILARY